MSFSGGSELFMERLREPLESKRRRYGALNHVLKLMSKLHHLERIRTCVNPEGVEGAEPRSSSTWRPCVFSVFPRRSSRRFFLIVLGHSSLAAFSPGR